MPLPGGLRSRLLKLKNRYRWVGVGEGLATLIAITCVLFTIQMVADWLLDMPWLARLGFLICDAVVWGAIYRFMLSRPLRSKLSLSQSALLVEDKWPRIGHALITAVELAEGKPYCLRGSPELVNVVLEQARARTTSLDFSEVVPARTLNRLLLLAGLTLMASLGLAYLCWPASLSLAERLFLFNIPLPTRTVVMPITRDLIVPTGSAVEISAEAKGFIPTDGHVRVIYSDGSTQELQVVAGQDRPGIFRLTIPNLQQAFKYIFYLNDGHGSEYFVQPKVVPAIDTLACRQTYPDYTSLPVENRSPDDLTLLAGSRLKIIATTTIPVRDAIISLKGPDKAKEIPATVDSSGTHIELEIPIPAKGLTGFAIHLTDQTGFGSTDETVYPIEVVKDEPPVVKITQPEDERITVTLHAKPTIVFDTSDDYGLSDLSLCYQITLPPAGGQEIGVTLPIQRIPIKLENTPRSNHTEYTFDIPAQTSTLQEGATINYWVEARDNNNVTGPGITKTERKQLGIVTVESKQAEILEHLKQTATAIGILSNSQEGESTKLGNAVAGSPTPPAK